MFTLGAEFCFNLCIILKFSISTWDCIDQISAACLILEALVDDVIIMQRF